MANLVDDPSVEKVVFFHGGRWVDGNGVEVKDHVKYRRQMRDAQPNAPVVHEPPDDSELDEDGDGEISAYERMNVKALQAEIDRRNEDREEEDQIEPEGTKKAQLIAALEADDEDADEETEEE